MPSDEAGDNRSHVPARRRLLPAFGRQLLVLADQLKGGRAHQLGDLATLPDEQLAGLVPAFSPQFDVYSDGEHVRFRRRKDGTQVTQLPATPENVLACSLIDGYSTLGQIGQRLASAHSSDTALGYAHARSTFLALARHGVCAPANPLEE